MNGSLFTGATGAIAQQQKLDIIANNLAAVNSAGFKPRVTSFSELMQYNLHDPEDVNTTKQALVGVKVQKDDTNFEQAGLGETGQGLDYAIEGDGFFKLKDPVTKEITYSRYGHFSMSDDGSGRFYLTNDSKKRIQDENNNDIVVEFNEKTGDYKLSTDIGIFSFALKNGMLSVGDNEFKPVEKNGNPYLNTRSRVVNKYLELSGTDVSYEFTKMIEAQRAYGFAIKLITTSDEVIQTINSLRS